MKVKIIRTTVVNGKTAVADSTVSTSDAEGRFLINIGKAEPADVKKEVENKIKSQNQTRG